MNINTYYLIEWYKAHYKSVKSPMKSMHELALEAANKIEPGLSKSIESFTDAKHPEIIHGRKNLQNRLDNIVKIVEDAISEYKSQEP